LAGGIVYKILSLSEEKKATELSRFTEVTSVFMNRHTEAVSVPVGKHGILYCQKVLWPEEENIKLYLCLKRKRPRNL
jgi:hypothetical protein